MKFLAFHGNQLEHNSSQGANGEGSAERIQPQGYEFHGRSIHNLCTDTIIHIAAYSSCKTMFLHACNKSDHLQLRPEAIILQFLRCLGNVTLWNIRLYLVTKSRKDLVQMGGIILGNISGFLAALMLNPQWLPCIFHNVM